MKYLISLFLICCATASAQTITLTPAQVADVCGPVAPPVEPEPTPEPTPTPPTPTQCQPGSGGQVVSWQSVFSMAFPRPAYVNVKYYRIPKDGYLAVQFRTGNIVDNGKVSLLENPATPGIRRGSISQCAGDFDAPSECSFVWGLGGGIRWATDGKIGACALQPNSTYYLNVKFDNCQAAPCYINIQHINF